MIPVVSNVMNILSYAIFLIIIVVFVVFGALSTFCILSVLVPICLVFAVVAYMISSNISQCRIMGGIAFSTRRTEENTGDASGIIDDQKIIDANENQKTNDNKDKGEKSHSKKHFNKRRMNADKPLPALEL